MTLYYCLQVNWDSYLAELAGQSDWGQKSICLVIFPTAILDDFARYQRNGCLTRRILLIGALRSTKVNANIVSLLTPQPRKER